MAKKKKTVKKTAKRPTAKKAAKKRRNPSVKTRQIKAAEKLFNKFNWEMDPEGIFKMKHRAIRSDDVLVQLGLLKEVVYESKKDGKTTDYVHKFKRGYYPVLISSADGKQLYIAGGKYFVNARGIVG